MYGPINMPSEGDGMTYVLMDQGYHRGERLANIGNRTIAAVIDAAVVLVVYAVAAGLYWVYTSILAALGVYTTAVDPLVALVLGLLPWAALVANSVLMQARSGQSLGKVVMGLVVVSPCLDPTNVAVTFYARPSVLLLIVRTALHLIVDLFLLVGVASILLSPRRETIADRVCNTLVLHPNDPDELTVYPNMIGARDR